MGFRRHHIAPRRVYMPLDPCKTFPSISDYGVWVNGFIEQHNLDGTASNIDDLVGAKIAEIGDTAPLVDDHPWVEVERIHRVGDVRYPSDLTKAAQKVEDAGGMGAAVITATVSAISAVGGDWSLTPDALDTPKLWPLWLTLSWAERVKLFTQLHIIVAHELYKVTGGGVEIIQPGELGNFLRASKCSTTSTTTSSAASAP